MAGSWGRLLPVLLGTVCLIQVIQARSYHGLSKEDYEEVQETMADIARIMGRKVKRDVSTSDVWYSPKQANYIRDSLRTRHRRKADLFDEGYAEKWDLPIKFQFDMDSFTTNERNTIKDAMKHWEQQTCIRFEEYPDGSSISGHSLLFVKTSNSCMSFTGRIQGLQEQEIELSPFCASMVGPMVHILGHAIGFHHEHQRSDRDAFVNVFEENVFDDPLDLWMSVAFQARTDDLVPYDYGSVMHFHSHAFSKNGRTTLRPSAKNGWYMKTIGQKNGLSFFDAKTANLLYCERVCNPSSLRGSCKNEGYQDPNNCATCICPEGFTGRNCEELASSNNASCDNNVVHVDAQTKKTVMSPGYSQRMYYPEGLACNWLVQAPKDHRVVLEMRKETFGVYCNTTCVDWLEIRDSPDLVTTGPKLCCRQNIQLTVTSESRQMLLLFRSQQSSPRQERMGFMVTVYAEPHPGMVDGPFNVGEGPPPPETTVVPSEPTSTTSRPITTTESITTTKTPTSSTTTKTPTSSTTTKAPTTTTTTTTTQVPTTTRQITAEQTCTENADLAFVLDGSSGVGSKNWGLQLDFVKSIIKELDIGLSKTRVGLVSYGNRGAVSVNLTECTSKNKLEEQINNIGFKGGASNTADGIRVMDKELFTRLAGDREDVRNLAVLMTDARSNRDQLLLAGYARDARKRTKLMVLGTTDSIDEDELEVIAGDDKNVKWVDDFDKLPNLKEDVIGFITSGAEVNCVDQASMEEEDSAKKTTTKPKSTTRKVEEESGEKTTTEPTTTKRTTTKRTTTKPTTTKPTTTKPTTTKPTTTTTKVPTSDEVEDSDSWSCDFEPTSEHPDGWCGLQLSGDYNWLRRSGNTPSPRTGPSVAASGQNYIFLETSDKKKGQKAVAFLKDPLPGGFYCLTFQYSMFSLFAKHMGNLTVIDKAETSSTKYEDVYNIVGKIHAQDDDDTKWTSASIVIEVKPGHLLGFQGTRGTGHMGDIALDNITLDKGRLGCDSSDED